MDVRRLGELDRIGLSVVMVAADGTVAAVNAAAAQLLGGSPASLGGRPLSELLAPSDAGGGDPLAAALAGDTWAGELCLPAADRQRRTALAQLGPLRDPDGAVAGVLLVAQPASERPAGAGSAAERLELLGRVSAVLASSLDLARTLAAFAHLVVPAFADHCVVDLLDEVGDRPRRVALVHAASVAPEVEAWTRPGEPVDYPADHPAAVAMATGRGVLEHSYGEPRFEHLAPTPGSARYARQVGVHSAMTVPLIARGHVLGAASFVTSASGRLFREADVAFAEELAARAAVAIDNARLYGREQGIALTLQRSLLPDELPTAPGLQAAAAYRPAASGAAVGGDWYDLVPLPVGRAAVVIGDVMGRGVRAAALMGQLRAAARAYAVQDLPPAEVLGHLDELVRGLDDSMLVTCVYAVYDPADATLAVANAGHLPPLLVGPRGWRRLPGGGVPLGAALPGSPAADYGEVAVGLTGAEVLVLYTDGLVERRGQDLDAAIERLGALLTPPPESLADGARTALAGFDAANVDDDVALLLVRPQRRTPPPAATLTLPADRAAAAAGAFVERGVVGWGEPAELAAAAGRVAAGLVVAVPGWHRPPGSLRVRLHGGQVVLELLGALDRPAVGPAGGPLADPAVRRWGSRPLLAGGRVVWCLLG